MPRKAQDARQATLNDVARIAGVSRQTVSNAINAPHLLRPDTLAQVLTAIDRLGYRPNRSARSLRTRQSRLIGYRIYPSHPDRLGWVLDRFLHAVADAARVAGYHLVVFTPENEAQELDTYAAMLQTRSVDGFIISDVTHRDERARWLYRRKVPFVAYGRLPEGSGDAWVDVDNAAGTALAVDHLVALGHRRIAFLGWAPGDRLGDERARGWRSAMERHGLSGRLVREHTLDRIPAARAAAERLLALADPPTAIVAASDTIAAGVLQAARARGLRVGPDLSVVGFDDTPSAALLTPALTSVSQPVEEVARLLVDMLVTRLAGRRPSRRAVLLAPTLTVRESSCPAPASVARG